MKNDKFLHTMDKYGVLDNASNKITQFYFDKIIATKTIDISNDFQLKYGWIFLSVVDGDNFELFYNDVCLIKCSSTREFMIPCLFEKSGNLIIKGKSNEVRLFIYGGSSSSQDKPYLLPFSKYIIKDRGKLCLLKYSTKDDIMSNNFEEIDAIENCLDIREYGSSSNPKLLWLISNSNSVYICMKGDENTEQFLVDTDIVDARIISNYNTIYVVYIKEDNVYYKQFDTSTKTFGSSVSFALDYKYIPKSLSRVQMDNLSSSAYVGVNFNDGGMHVYKITLSGCVRLLSRRADFSKIIVDGDDFILVAITDYDINIEKFGVSEQNVVSSLEDTMIIYNANDMIKIGDEYLVFANGVCSEIKYGNS